MVNDTCGKIQALWIALILTAGISGCATPPIPPEATMQALRQSYDQIARLVASGQISPEQGRDQYYRKLTDVAPNLPGLDALVDYRRELQRQVAAGALTSEQANAQLTTRETERLARWEEMSAQYAAEQRRLEQLQNNYERGYQEQKRIEEGSGIRNLPPGTPK